MEDLNEKQMKEWNTLAEYRQLVSRQQGEELLRVAEPEFAGDEIE
ncbi:UNVERIFIED_ORG: hypothetical protein M2328_001092 [Rhodococcus erythropolis]